MLTALAFMLVNGASYTMALARGPFWGLLAYANIYFNSPNPDINWWAGYLPFERWALLTSAILLVSVAVHWSNLSDRKLGSAKWAYVFFIVSLIVTMTLAVNQDNANRSQYMLFTYCLIIFIMIKSILDEKQLRWFLLASIVMAANLSVNAWLYGRRVNDRLEGIGSADSFGANEFGLLLASLIPFIAVLMFSGKKYERLLCLLATPFILNAFILCNSRGAAVALILAISLSALVFADRKIHRGLLGISILAIPVLIWLMDDAYKERFLTLAGGGRDDNYGYQTEADIDEVSSGRVEIWNYGMEMAADHPMGAGPDSFNDLARFYMPPELLVYKEGFDYGRRAAHNTYLKVVVEQGILGLTVFLLMCISVCLALRRSLKEVKRTEGVDQFWRYMIFATAVSFLTTLAGGLVTNRVYYEFFWWQIAIAVIVSSLARLEVARLSQQQDQKLEEATVPA